MSLPDIARDFGAALGWFIYDLSKTKRRLRIMESCHVTHHLLKGLGENSATLVIPIPAPPSEAKPPERH